MTEAQAPRVKRGMGYWLGKAVLAVSGWEIDGGAPTEAKYVAIAAPHTSNWDLVYSLAIANVLGLEMSWVGKHTLFAPPLGGFMRWIGGIPIDRRGRHDAVRTLAAEFAARDRLVLLVPPEGTRKKAAHWKSGFYWIAKEAGVPISMGFLDYGRKRGGLGPMLHPSGDLEADLAKLRAFYADKQGKFPAEFSEVRFKPEESVPASGSVAREPVAKTG